MIRPLLLASAALFSLSAHAVIFADVQRSQSVFIQLGSHGAGQSDSLSSNGALSVNDPTTIAPCVFCITGLGTPPTASPQLNASSSIGSYPSPFLSANASSPSSPIGSNASARASFTYQFFIVALPSALPISGVPWLITGAFGLSANGDAHADGHLSFYNSAGGVINISVSCRLSDPCLPPPVNQPDTFDYQVRHGSESYAFSATGALTYDPVLGFAKGGITLIASAAAGWDGFGTNSASAFIDPVITIDPVFAASHPGYSLVVSDGVGNSLTSAVPEPAEWELITAGIALLSVRTRRRRHSAHDAV